MLAMLLDLGLGDPPNRYHPVAWMGGAIGVIRRRAPHQHRGWTLLYGAVLVVGGLMVVSIIGIVVEALLRLLPLPWYWLAEACVLKTTFALRGLVQAAQQVQGALDAGELERARQ